ncbi:MAG: hypothetical protein IGQ45_00180 [Cyanobacterium sp. T60_A2020_053]|nr:hypothetical protein [Cyanobacterium sp. T60_A2020_053]
MKAIVLTCDKYLQIANHTIFTYQKLWKNNPFTFRVPYTSQKPDFLLENYGDKIELIQSESPIKPTVLKLLDDLDDDEWIYWCMDDRYLVKIRLPEVNSLYECVKKLDDKDIISIRIKRMNTSYTADKFLKKDGDIIVNEKLTLKELVFSDGDTVGGEQVWEPQFARVKYIRRIFASFPDHDFRAKEMDSFPKHKLKGEKLYVPENNLVVLGESTHRGELTENCASNLKKYSMVVPSQFNITNKYMIHGKLPYSFMGTEFYLPSNVQWFVTSVYRWYWRNRN